MSRRVLVELVCDLCGSTGDVEEVQLKVAGASYWVDLCTNDRSGLDAALAAFVSVARKRPRAGAKNSRPSGAARVQPRRPRRDPEQTSAVRAWARKNGFDLSERGRIPRAVEEAYKARAKG